MLDVHTRVSDLFSSPYDQIREQLESIGAVICAAGQGLAPVDRKLYALRDVTGTVESIPLISSSIMSKKIAEGTSALVLDVKVGSGAFIKTIERARQLATTMVGLGTSHGVATIAQLTSMDAPLGDAVGNALEVTESVDVLRGGGPSDVRELTVSLARTMVELVGIEVDPATKLDDGSAYEVYERMIVAQGGDPDAALPVAALHDVVVAQRDGVDFNLAFIGADFNQVLPSPFDAAYMRALYDYGYQRGSRGYDWAKKPPLL